jgi:wyosine [tRNA(Phe)-imidazoG37] synthetase (radical SAM superfamily)
LKPLGIKIAVISNSSLLFHQSIREDLLKSDLVSLKVDSVIPRVWKVINRPIKFLRLGDILKGILEFAKTYNGKLVTETMLVKNVTYDDDQMTELADFLAKLKPFMAYLSIPTRPPAYEWVKAAGSDAVNRIFQVFKERMDRVEYLIGYEGNEFSSTGHIEEDLLSITAVHPLREDAVENLLTRARKGWDVVHKLIEENLIIKEQYEGRTFYLRKIP